MSSHKRRGKVVRIMKKRKFVRQDKKIKSYPIKFYKELVERCKIQLDVANKIKEVISSHIGSSVLPNDGSFDNRLEEKLETIVTCCNTMEYYLCEVCGNKPTALEGNVAAIALRANGFLIDETIKAAQLEFVDGRFWVPLWVPFDSVQDIEGKMGLEINKELFKTDLK